MNDALSDVLVHDLDGVAELSKVKDAEVGACVLSHCKSSAVSMSIIRYIAQVHCPHPVHVPALKALVHLVTHYEGQPRGVKQTVLLQSRLQEERVRHEYMVVSWRGYHLIEQGLYVNSCIC